MTVASLVVALAAAGATATGLTRPGLALWLLSRVGDGLDGVLARAIGQASVRGGYLDITLDMAAYSLMVVAFAALHPELGIVYVLSITTTLALAGAAERAHRTISRTDRTYQFTPAVAEAGETTTQPSG